MPDDPKTIKSHEADPNVFTKTVTETFRVEHAHSPAALSLHSSLGFFRYGQLCPVSFPLSLLHINIFLTAAPEDFMAMPPAQNSSFLCRKPSNKRGTTRPLRKPNPQFDLRQSRRQKPR